jgi:hypothetical protein
MSSKLDREILAQRTTDERRQAAYSFGWWLMADVDLFGKKKYCSLIDGG